jgi:hypothetical protein
MEEQRDPAKSSAAGPMASTPVLAVCGSLESADTAAKRVKGLHWKSRQDSLQEERTRGFCVVQHPHILEELDACRQRV